MDSLRIHDTPPPTLCKPYTTYRGLAKYALQRLKKKLLGIPLVNASLMLG